MTQIRLTTHVAYWDWPAVEPFVRCWLEHVDRILLVVNTKQDWRGKPIPDHYFINQKEQIRTWLRAPCVDVLFTDAPMVDSTDWRKLNEPRMRIMALCYYPHDGGCFVELDVDCLPYPGIYYRARFEKLVGADPMFLEADLVDVIRTLEGDRAMVVKDPMIRRIATNQFGASWGKCENIGKIVHWRSSNIENPEAAAYHDSYFGAGFSERVANLKPGDSIKGLGGSDARRWEDYEIVPLSSLVVDKR